MYYKDNKLKCKKWHKVDLQGGKGGSEKNMLRNVNICKYLKIFLKTNTFMQKGIWDTRESLQTKTHDS